MSKRIKAADLPDFDAAPYLDGEVAIAAYLTDILESNASALLVRPWATLPARAAWAR